MQKSLEELTKTKKYIIEREYGLNEGKKTATLNDIREELGISYGKFKEIEHSAFVGLWLRRKGFCSEIKGDKYLTDKERQQFEEIKKNIQLQNGDVYENLEKLKKIQEKSRTRKEEEEGQLEKEKIEKQEKSPQELNKEREDSLKVEHKEENRPKTELGKKIIDVLVEDSELKKGKIDDIKVATEEDKTEVSSENKVTTEEQIAANDEQNKKEINFEEMTPEQLQKLIDDNQKIIEKNAKQIEENTKKNELIQRLLEQQKTIDEQQEEINRLRKLIGSPQL